MKMSDFPIDSKAVVFVVFSKASIMSVKCSQNKVNLFKTLTVFVGLIKIDGHVLFVVPSIIHVLHAAIRIIF